jgi:hypothetical protein
VSIQPGSEVTFAPSACLSAPFTRSATMRAGDADQLIPLSSATLPSTWHCSVEKAKIASSATAGSSKLTVPTKKRLPRPSGGFKIAWPNSMSEQEAAC